MRVCVNLDFSIFIYLKICLNNSLSFFMYTKQCIATLEIIAINFLKDRHIHKINRSQQNTI